MDSIDKAVAPPPRAEGDGLNPTDVGMLSAPLGGQGTAGVGRGNRADMLLSNTIAYVLLLLGAALFITPFLFLVSTALKSVDETNEFPPSLIPRETITTTIGGQTVPVLRVQGTGQLVARVGLDGENVVAVPLDAKLQPVSTAKQDIPAGQVKEVKRFRLLWSNFREALTQPGMPFGRFFLNTLLIVVLNVTGATLSAALCAYGFARLRFRGRGPLFILLLSTMMIPGQVTMIPVYILFKELHWINTYLPLTVPAWFGGGAFSIFLLRQFFQGIPFEMEEAARIDGCGPLTTWWRIILPLSIPALATIAIFTFMGAWNDFMGPLIYLNDTNKFTLALGLSLFKGQYGTDTPQFMMAATLVVLLPVLVLFFVAQKQFIQGIVVSGLKG